MISSLAEFWRSLTLGKFNQDLFVVSSQDDQHDAEPQDAADAKVGEDQWRATAGAGGEGQVGGQKNIQTDYL